MTWVSVVVQGILLGGLYALFACGLSLLFGVMRIINLAHGDLAVLAAYLAVTLAPMIGLPGLWSIVLVVPLFAAFGYLLQRSLIQASVERGPLTALLVTFGLSVVIQNLLLQVFTADSHSVDIGSLASGSLHLGGGLSVGTLSVIIFGVAVAVLLGLQVLLSRSTIGRLIRAVADDREATRLSGIDPRAVFAAATAIAFATVAIAGIAFGGYSSFAPTSGSGRLLFAFEAVVIGGLGSLWGTLLGGIVLGVAQAIGAHTNPADAVLYGHAVFLITLAVRPQGLTGAWTGWAGARRLRARIGSAARELLVRGRAAGGVAGRAAGGIAGRAAEGDGGAAAGRGGTSAGPSAGPVRVTRSRGRIGWLALLAAGTVALLAYLPYLVYSRTTDLLINVFILLTMATMWNLLAGYAGLMSVGQQAFVGLGAYLVLILAQNGFNPLVAIPGAAVIAAALALPMSWLLFRLRGGYFAIATWVIADAAQLIISRFPSLGGGTGKALPGLAGVRPVMLTAYTYWAALVVVVLAVGSAYLLLRAPVGLALTSVRDNEIGARSIGVRVARTRRTVFLVAALGTAAAGGLLAVSQLSVEPTSAFSVQWSAAMIFVCVIGGIGSLEGPVIGTVVYFGLQQALAPFGAWYLILVGVLAVAVAIWAPRGLWGIVADRLGWRLFPVGYWLWAEVS